ncbi:class I SAM-dependent methyltransferase [Streptomyces pactum]|uniref:SAM-dependent methyltransferase n=1 Tax=Streptomyces pactum TaxID=68249 RepID=A0A1S6J989_9ACTN|nr:class I SAM-dependent methyltransferase [Streptomyces pactum]AQS68298.1 SAM-dependent methyltransferase [Streptomyces pactum]
MTTPGPVPPPTHTPTHAAAPAPTPARATTHTARAHSFNAAAAQYAAGRPSYPPALFDAIGELAGRPLAGARVADIGAGTGIATARLHARGADVIAVEPGAGMAAEFRRTRADVPIVRGSGNALPLADHCADLLTYAQAWHWTDPARAVPEALRVLRPGGALALWWNTDALDVPWIAASAARVQRHFGLDIAAEKRDVDAGAADPTGRLRFTRREIRWSRRVPLETHLANIGSHSIFLTHGEEHSAAFLAEERRHLLAAFPDGAVEETYDTVLLLATTPTASTASTAPTIPPPPHPPTA